MIRTQFLILNRLLNGTIVFICSNVKIDHALGGSNHVHDRPLTKHDFWLIKKWRETWTFVVKHK